jgi:small-conductance mechanosensitive channel
MIRFDAIEITPELLRQFGEIVTIAIVTLIVDRVVVARIPKLFPSASLIVTVLRITVIAVGFLVILGSFGVSITPILTALGVGGLAVALALRDTLANLFSGIQILASRQVAPGDFVRFDGGEGYVLDITWRNTTITDIAGARIIVPNEKLALSIVTNSTRPDGISVMYQFGFHAALMDAPAMIAAARAALEPLGIADVRILSQTEVLVNCVAIVHAPRTANAFEIRNQIAEAVAMLPRMTG